MEFIGLMALKIGGVREYPLDRIRIEFDIECAFQTKEHKSNGAVNRKIFVNGDGFLK